MLTPQGWDAAAVPGWGDHRIRVRDIDVAFSGEDVGWQVIIKDGLDAKTADALVDTVARQLAVYSGEPTEWICVQE